MPIDGVVFIPTLASLSSPTSSSMADVSHITLHHTHTVAQHVHRNLFIRFLHTTNHSIVLFSVTSRRHLKWKYTLNSAANYPALILCVNYFRLKQKKKVGILIFFSSPTSSLAIVHRELEFIEIFRPVYNLIFFSLYRIASTIISRKFFFSKSAKFFFHNFPSRRRRRHRTNDAILFLAIGNFHIML